MNSYSSIKGFAIVLAATCVSMVSGCANYEVNTNRGNIPGHFIRYEMQEADRAVEDARQSGKDRACPAEFKAAEDAKNNAYDVFRACHDEEGVALAKQATQKANALCPPMQVKAAPNTYLSIVPGSIAKGESAKMTWTSQNAEECTINPNIGKVQPQGSMMITPTDNTAYTIVCTGAGGKADSAANIVVAAAASQPKAAPLNTCEPIVINIKFDTNKADIKANNHDELKKIADFLTTFPNASGNIEGYTDSVGSKASNIKLSQRRADSVRNYLIKNFSIAPDRLGAKGFGPAKPIADNNKSAGKQKKPPHRSKLQLSIKLS